MESTPTPSSGSFDLDSGGVNTALGRGGILTPGGMALSTTSKLVAGEVEGAWIQEASLSGRVGAGDVGRREQHKAAEGDGQREGAAVTQFARTAIRSFYRIRTSSRPRRAVPEAYRPSPFRFTRRCIIINTSSSQSDAASSSVASANALLIQNVPKLLTGGVPTAPPPVPPRVSVPVLQPTEPAEFVVRLTAISTTPYCARSHVAPHEWMRNRSAAKERGSGETFGKVPFPRSRSRPKELGSLPGYAMRIRSRGRTLSSLSRAGPEIFERDARMKASVDSMDSGDSTAS
ncbi:hypothetical protein FS837_004668 [Tulasnella sp. UAMH 9824]|nr:hypothetical protein FS837_004668 [Tulasnella sp. UAMH 9824]